MTDVPVCGFRPGRHSSAVSSNLHSRLFTFEAPKSGRAMADFPLSSRSLLAESCQSPARALWVALRVAPFVLARNR